MIYISLLTNEIIFDNETINMNISAFHIYFWRPYSYGNLADKNLIRSKKCFFHFYKNYANKHI